jgi:acyl-CoA synthetase (AMP-forming)/AMP-acid ligase II
MTGATSVSEPGFDTPGFDTHGQPKGQSMDAAAAGPPLSLATLPDRISHVIRKHVLERPDHPALADATTTWTFSALSAIVADTATRLTAYGVRPGDRLLVVSENSLPLAAFVLAASEIDAWAVVVNPRLSPREIDQIRDHSGARRVFYVTAIAGAARDHATRHGASIDSLGQLGLVAVGPLNETVTPETVEADGARQVAVLVYTSGTTGNPKGVMLSHRNLLFNALAGGQVRGLTTRDRIYGVLPMSHIVGLSSVLVSSLLFGATVQVVPRYDPAVLVRAIGEDGITALFGVPATYQRLLEYQTLSGQTALPRGRLRYLGVAGAPLDLSLKTRIEATFGIPMLNGYGITECAPGISLMRPENPEANISVGPPLPGVELRVVDNVRQPVPIDSVGELHVRSPGVMLGYYRAPDLTAAAIDADGWFNTGDLVRFDGTRLFVVGRTKELIIRSGFNVYPPEVEAVLNTHPEVVQPAVIGRFADGNEEVVAYVQLLPGSNASAATLMNYVRPQLTAYKRPSEIVILETLPASSTGKILKHKLTEAARAAANI